jgi:hypothetical protein
VWHLQPPARRASVPARRAPISWARPFRRGEPDPLHLAAGQLADGPSGHVAYAGDVHGPADGVAVRGGFPGAPAPVRMAAERDDLTDPSPPGHTPLTAAIRTSQIARHGTARPLSPARPLLRQARCRRHGRCCRTYRTPLLHGRPLLLHERPPLLHGRPPLLHGRPPLLHERPLRVPLRPATVPSHAPRRPPHARITARGPTSRAFASAPLAPPFGLPFLAVPAPASPLALLPPPSRASHSHCLRSLPQPPHSHFSRLPRAPRLSQSRPPRVPPLSHCSR